MVGMYAILGVGVMRCDTWSDVTVVCHCGVYTCRCVLYAVVQ